MNHPDAFIERIDGFANRLADEAEKAEEEIRRAGERRADEISEITKRIRLATVDSAFVYAIVSTLVCKARAERTMHTMDLDMLEEAIYDLGGGA